MMVDPEASPKVVFDLDQPESPQSHTGGPAALSSASARRFIPPTILRNLWLSYVSGGVDCNGRGRQFFSARPNNALQRTRTPRESSVPSGLARR